VTDPQGPGLPGPHLPETRRDDAPAPTRREEDTPPAPTRREEGGVARWRLPSIITARFEVEHAFAAGGTEADTFLVRSPLGERLFAKVYRRGIRPNTEVLKRLSSAAAAHVIRFIEAGYSEEDECHYELLEYAERGTLADLGRKEGPQVAAVTVREVLRELDDALRHVHQLGIEHRDLKPANVLVRSREPLDLVLTDFGIASVMEGTHRFTSTNRTVWYAPPEAMTGAIHRTRWDYWSLGIIVVEMLTGAHPFADQSEQVATLRLISRSTDELVEQVADPQWRKLCRGLLRRDPKSRWDGDAVQRWLANPDDPELTVAEEGGGVVDQAPPFRFLGKPHRSTQELAGTVAENWNEGLRLWKQDEQRALLRWLRDDLGNLPLAEQVEAVSILDRSKDAGQHAQLFLLIHMLDPGRAPSFLGRPLSIAELGRAADGAVAGHRDDAGWLESLYHSGVMALTGNLPTAERRVIELGPSWNRSVAEYNDIRGKHMTAGAESSLALLLAGAVPASKALASLRQRAATAATTTARKRIWYRDLGVPAQANATAAILLIELAQVAEAEVRSERRDRAERNVALWQSMGRDAIIAGSVSSVWWYLVSEWCSTGASMCTDAGWGHNDLGIGGTVILSAIWIVALGVLIRVHHLTTAVQDG